MSNNTATAYKEIKRGSVISAISTVFGICSTLLVTPYVLRMIGDGDYGIYQMVAPILASLYTLNFGLSNSVVRFLAKYRSANDKKNEEKLLGMMMIVFAIIAFVAVSIGTLCFFLLPKFFSELSAEELFKARVMFAIMVINMGLVLISQIYPSIMTAYEKFTTLHSMGLAKNVFTPIFKVVLLHFGVGVFSLVISEFVFNVIYQLVIMLCCKVKLKVRFVFNGFDMGLLRELFVFSSFIFLGTIADLLYWQVDKVIVGIVISNDAVTPLSIGNHFAEYFIKIATIISGMLMMRVMTLVINKANGTQLTNAMIKLGRIQLLVLGLIYCGYIIVGRQFLNYYYSSGTEHTRNVAFIIGLMLLTSLIIPEI